MKTISKFTKEDVLAFIEGVQATTEMGQLIDDRKQLTWDVMDYTEASVFLLSAKWIKGITYAKVVSDPQLQMDDIAHPGEHYFQVLCGETKISFASSIVDAIDYVNSNEFNED